eukprot:TRINITY_DN94484_c0_g1_i1.p1 TRINITY_DN94484_c0_g1~~TRINITY_DN94484_c0_g1_i1.p1  ORF type:complete len:193 (+),score=42.09 TRINITY_DN94484_c0_g1_i1:122-700(+)
MIYIFKACCAPCKCCEKACQQVGDCLNPILSRPLGFYVLATWLTMLGVVLLTVLGMQDCNMALVGGNCVLGVVHGGFSYYLFLQLNKAAGDGASGREVLAQIWKIGLYDIGVCIYIFVYIASLGFQFYGMSASSGCNGGGSATGGALLMIVYQTFGIGTYFLYFFCFQTCCAPGGGGGSRGGPAPHTMGASA